VKSDLANNFVNWLVSPKGQATIAGFKQNGQSLVFPNSR
jgi:tungstate transport system substrate-binding protein